jgi:type II secretory pathway pseudopilin PulG
MFLVFLKKLKLYRIKGITILESMVVMMLFSVAIIILSQMYFNLMRSAILAQEMQLSLDNIRFGNEKLWLDIKNGSDFVTSSNRLDFKDRFCRSVKIYFSSNNLIYEISGTTSTIFDNDLVELKSFRIYYDNPSSGSSYYQTANKVFVFYYQFDLKTKVMTIPFEIRQTVAPLNSVFPNNPCP